MVGEIRDRQYFELDEDQKIGIINRKITCWLFTLVILLSSIGQCSIQDPLAVGPELV